MSRAKEDRSLRLLLALLASACEQATSDGVGACAAAGQPCGGGAA